MRDAPRHKSAPRLILKIGRRASRNTSPRWSVGTIIQPERDWRWRLDQAGTALAFTSRSQTRCCAIALKNGSNDLLSDTTSKPASSSRRSNVSSSLASPATEMALRCL
ncbi:hypothetical protein CFN58_15620 [Pseudomonas avellanae]|uniref:DUF1534 domain-containing protein n=1 Tax=Pseudomonas avellanae TaxID=46257 RepID=A0A261WIQ0_9PSED|nr:hypothetical protein JN853_03910 [Pseudomonas syringae pv. actinidiae ICMP 9853]AQX61650.1 hypothetical protein B1R35_28855 [Pseudomonas syringae pv. actinidiae]OZI85852.1 hypothetical protein CFN58_15620 [Pseudomonas avellanae]AQX67550.1 hypothetical protein B1F85_28895 [Pseudomonas syringae pv. actinidiae]PHZ42716.1 hypothetical protein CS297_04195 [Pseudomonas syringae pv. actinidiae]